MKKIILTSIASLGLLASLSAVSFTYVSDVNGAATGSNLVNFDSAAVGGGIKVINSDLTVSFAGPGGVVTGSATDKAAPYISGMNGVGFGNPGNQPNGVDATNYLTTGVGDTIFQFSSAQKYFGLLWGSVDAYNTLSFYSGATLLEGFTGAQVDATPNGDRGLNGSTYVNFYATSGVTFDRVVANSTTNAFEIDNVAYDKTDRVPEAGSTLALIGLAFTGLVSLRRKLS